jgi:hypothetical protein
METLTVYCSQPASGQMATFLLAAGQGHQLVVRPITELPAPDLQRRQQLRAERVELLDEIKLSEFMLEQYRCGQLQPDTGHEQGLRYMLDTCKSRLRGIDTVLGTEKGAADNA